MKVAAAVKDGVIAPALNESTEVMIVTEENGQPVSKEVISLDGAGITSVLFKLSMQNIDVMLAGEVGYVFQNPDDQIFHNNVEDEIRFGPKKQGLSEEEIVKKTEWAAKLCGLSEQMQENPYNLPLSIRKFVSIASVLAMDDKILILDEPTAGQDLIGINRLENILTELKKENKTVVTITHDMEFAVNNFKKIFVMSHKNLLRVGNAKEIFSDDELLKDSMLKKTYIGDLCDRLNLNETAVTIEEFLKYFV